MDASTLHGEHMQQQRRTCKQARHLGDGRAQRADDDNIIEARRAALIGG